MMEHGKFQLRARAVHALQASAESIIPHEWNGAPDLKVSEDHVTATADGRTVKVPFGDWMIFDGKNLWSQTDANFKQLYELVK